MVIVAECNGDVCSYYNILEIDKAFVNLKLNKWHSG